MRLISVLFLTVLPLFSAGQPFWKKTSLLPDSSLPSVVTTDDNLLLAATYTGKIFISENNGQSWTSVFSGQKAIYSLLVYGNSWIAGRQGDVMISSDRGLTWLTYVTGSSYPFMRIFHSRSGFIFGLSGDPASGMQGDWVWRSADGGRSWNNTYEGLNGNGYVAHIAEDSKGRLYLGAAAGSGTSGGLFYSENSGENWIETPLFIDGKSAIENDIHPREFLSVWVSPEDSIHISLIGAAGAFSNPVSVNFTLTNSSELTGNWQILSIGTGSSIFWQRTWLYGMKNNGCNQVIGSFGPSVTRGGPYRKLPDGTWERIVSGLEITSTGYQPMDIVFTENGRVYGIQWTDRNIYYSDVTACWPMGEKPSSSSNPVVFPNPAHIRLLYKQEGAQEVSVYTLTGQLVYTSREVSGEINTELWPDGMYCLIIRKDNGISESARFIVRH